MFKIHQKKINLFYLSIIPIFSFINSITQGLYAYDGFHWGLVLFSADGMSKNIIPYKDLFIHYGFLTTKLNSFVLATFKHNFIYVFMISSLAYALSLFIMGILLLRFTNIFFSLLGLIIIFSLHPYANFPWHTYYIFFLVNIFLILRFSKNIRLNYLSYFILSSIILFSESFWLASILIFIFDVFFVNFYFKHEVKINLYKLISKVFIYFIPIIIFIIYLFANNLFEHWLVYNQMGKIFFEILDMNYFQLIIQYFHHLINITLSRLLSEPNWLIYFLLILINFVYLLSFIIKKFNKKISNEDYHLILISFCSLILLYQTLHSVAIFKFSCGLILGLIVIIKLITKIKNLENQIIISVIILLYSISAFSFSKNNSNQLYVYKFKKDEYIKDDYFKFFKSQKWDNKTWSHLKITDQNINKISSKCKIKNGVNFSSDGIVSVIMREKLIFNQLLPWYENIEGSWQSRYFNTMWRYFDKEYFEVVENMIENNDVIIYSSIENYPNLKFFNKEINLENKMSKIDLPYSYTNKNKILIIPKECKNSFF